MLPLVYQTGRPQHYQGQCVESCKYCSKHARFQIAEELTWYKNYSVCSGMTETEPAVVWNIASLPDLALLPYCTCPHRPLHYPHSGTMSTAP